MTIATNDKLKQIISMLSEIDSIYQKMLSSHNLSDSTYLIMHSILELGEGCLQKDIAKNFFTNKKTINAAIKKLEKEGYIILKPGKYPNMHIYLTPIGKKFVDENVLPLIDIENKVLEVMPDNEFENLAYFCRMYVDAFKKEVDEFIKNK